MLEKSSHRKRSNNLENKSLNSMGKNEMPVKAAGNKYLHLKGRLGELNYDK